MIASVCHVDVASPVDGDPVGRAEQSVAGSFDSYGAQKGAGRREFFDSSVIRIGDQNISVCINSNSSRRIKFSLAGSPAALERVSYTLRHRTKLGGRCVRHLVDYKPIVSVVLEHLWEISGIQPLIGSFNELTLPNRIIIRHVLDAILFQKPENFPRVLALEQLCVKPVVLGRVVTG